MEKFDDSKAGVAAFTTSQAAVVVSGPVSRPREDSGEVGLKQEAPTAMLNNGRGRYRVIAKVLEIQSEV